MAVVCRLRLALTRLSSIKTVKKLNTIPETNSWSAFNNNSKRNYSSFGKSPFVINIKQEADYEIFKDPKEWKYIERLLPVETVPPVKPKEVYPSGWIPPRPELYFDSPYVITRTKNHMLPIYLCLSEKNKRRTTKIRRIDGDIWKLNDDIQQYLKKKYGREVMATRVHELCMTIEIKGDYVIDVRNWATSKGF